MIARLLIAMIRFYQAILSPWLPVTCRFHPTCSEYGAQAIRAHGAIRGGILTIRRLLRCRPGGGGGEDPVP